MSTVDDVLAAAMMDALHERKLTQVVLQVGPLPTHKVRIIIVPEQLEYLFVQPEPKEEAK